MLDLVYLILSLLSYINIKVKGFNTFFDDYMDLENTSAIKGLFVWMIFFRHFTGYLKYYTIKNKKSIIIDKAFDQNIVSLFLFYSGFGIFESFKKKGNKYIKTLPIKGIIILIKSEIILFIFFCNNQLLKKKIPYSIFFQAIIFRKSIGNSYWFCFAIISLYFHTFFAFYFIHNRFSFIGILLITIICAIHVYCVYNYYHPREIISVDTIICFLLGFYFSFSKNIIDKIFNKNDILYFGIIFTLVLLYYKFYTNMQRIIFYVSIKNGIYTIIIILVSMKIRLKNDFLLLLNRHSYSIYLLQRVIMIYVSAKRIFNDNIFISFFFEFTGILFISSLFDKYTSFIDIIILRKKLGKKYEKLSITEK